MKTLTKALLAAALVVGVFASNAAFAEDGADKERPNRQGKRGGFMKEMDTNNDQEVSQEEWNAWHVKKSAERFKRMDSNGDGVINKDDRKKRGGDGGQGPGGGDGDGEGETQKQRQRGPKQF